MLKVQNISFSYLDKPVLKNISIELANGNVLAVIGESGCGKSTLLQLIYGLYDLDEGQIFYQNQAVLGPKYHLVPGMEYMKYLAQDFDLMPFITVAENVGKYLSNMHQEKKQARIHELLALVEMTEFATVKAKFLSGGQMQRVALARVLALEPQVLLLDEPFSHIDNFRKNSLRRKLFAYLKEKKITTIVATHDSMDVLSFAEEVVVLKEGKVVEKGFPKALYQQPKSIYVASLFGDVNEIDVAGKKMICYPNQLVVVSNSEMEVTVLKNYFKGNHYLLEARFKNQLIYFENKIELPIGSVVYLKKADF